MRPSTSFTRLSEKGQATVPLHIREHLNLSPGDYVAYEIDPHGRVILAKAKIGVETPNTEKKAPPQKLKNKGDLQWQQKKS